jgi:hypothetical protein
MKVLVLLLAICGTTLNALWPLIADANAVAIPGDICSANAAARQNRGAEPGEEPQHHSHRLLHCALCSASAHSDAAIPSRFIWIDAIPAENSAYSATEASIPPPVAIYSLAISRAPPVFS